MPHRTAIVNLVALTPRQLEHMPRLSAFMSKGTSRRLAPPFPAVTCTSQTTMLTGVAPTVHGIVGNGWHDRLSAETAFWKQANGLVQAPRIWDTLSSEDPSISTANCFWWYAMYAATDVTITPRPMYPADGRKMPDLWTRPADLRHTLQQSLGQFPLFNFWGPGANITSSRWIADATLKVEAKWDPTMLFCYLPHLDYGLQKFGPDAPEMLTEYALFDDLVTDLLEALAARGRRLLVVNEYGIMPVREAVFPNRLLRDMGMLSLRMEYGREHLDAGASRGFAVPDHQIAHLYLRNPADAPRVAEAMVNLDGVDRVLDDRARRVVGLDHDRAGDLVLVAEHNRWMAHDWWEDEAKAPDWQRTVDIHRKPGYDPRELFIDPAIPMPRAAVAWRLFKRKLGMRTLLDVVPTDTSLVKGSHGRPDPEFDPVIWCSETIDLPERVQAGAVCDVIAGLVLD